MENCYDCGRKFVEKIKDTIKECICSKWLCGEEIDNTRRYDCLRYLCSDCDHEQRRSNRRRDRAERELTPGKKRTTKAKKPKEKK
jgi:hypothetical protein